MAGSTWPAIVDPLCKPNWQFCSSPKYREPLQKMNFEIWSWPVLYKIVLVEVNVWWSTVPWPVGDGKSRQSLAKRCETDAHVGKGSENFLMTFFSAESLLLILWIWHMPGHTGMTQGFWGSWLCTQSDAQSSAKLPTPRFSLFPWCVRSEGHIDLLGAAMVGSAGIRNEAASGL